MSSDSLMRARSSSLTAWRLGPGGVVQTHSNTHCVSHTHTHTHTAHPSAVGGHSPAAPWRLHPAPAAWGGCPAGPRRLAKKKKHKNLLANRLAGRDSGNNRAVEASQRRSFCSEVRIVNRTPTSSRPTPHETCFIHEEPIMQEPHTHCLCFRGGGGAQPRGYVIETSGPSVGSPGPSRTRLPWRCCTAGSRRSGQQRRSPQHGLVWTVGRGERERERRGMGQTSVIDLVTQRMEGTKQQ